MESGEEGGNGLPAMIIIVIDIITVIININITIIVITIIIVINIITIKVTHLWEGRDRAWGWTHTLVLLPRAPRLCERRNRIYTLLFCNTHSHIFWT